MNPFEHIVEISEVAEKFGITRDYLGRILRGRDPFPVELVEGVDFKLYSRLYLISISGVEKLGEGFEKIRNKSLK